MKHTWLRMDKVAVLHCPICAGYSVSEALGDRSPRFCTHCGQPMLPEHWDPGYKAAIAPRDEHTKITVRTLKEETF